MLSAAAEAEWQIADLQLRATGAEASVVAEDC